MAKSSSRSPRRGSLQANVKVGSILTGITNPAKGKTLMGHGLTGLVGGLVGLALSAAIGIIALVLISLAYTQIEAVDSVITTYALASLSLGAVALGLQVIGVFLPNRTPMLGGRLMSLLVMAAYISAAVLALLAAASLPAQSTVQIYALVAGVFYAVIAGAFL